MVGTRSASRTPLMLVLLVPVAVLVVVVVGLVDVAYAIARFGGTGGIGVAVDPVEAAVEVVAVYAVLLGVLLTRVAVRRRRETDGLPPA